MVICFCKNPDHVYVPNIKIDGNEIYRVETTKVLGVTVSSDLTRNVHVENIISKASKMVYLLYQLKRARVSQNDLLNVFFSVIRPVLEYACPVWHTNLTKYLSGHIETVQKRALRVISPGHPYDEILHITDLPTLSQRREQLCKEYFKKLQNESHKLHNLLPRVRQVPCDIRSINKYPLVNARISRYFNSFIPWCLRNTQ